MTPTPSCDLLVTLANCDKARSVSIQDGCKAMVGQRRIYLISRTPSGIAVVSAVYIGYLYC
jgi:hypothetical protein